MPKGRQLPRTPLEEAIFKNDIQVKKVTFEEVKHNSLLKKSLDKIEGKFDFNKRKENTMSRIIAADSSFTILTEEIIQVTANGKTTYAFGIVGTTNPNSSFENFVIEQLEDDTILFYIYRYKEDENGDGVDSDEIIGVSRELVDADRINMGDFDGFMDRVFYDSESGCYFSATQSAGVLIITVISCGNEAGSSTDDSIGGGSGNYGPWAYFVMNDSGYCLRVRAILDANGNPTYKSDGITPATESQYPVECENGTYDNSPNDNDSPPDDTNTSGSENTDPNYDPIHDDIPEGGGSNNGTNTDDDDPSGSSTVGVVKSPSNADIAVNDFFENLNNDQSICVASNRQFKDNLELYLRSNIERIMGEVGMEWSVATHAELFAIDAINAVCASGDFDLMNEVINNFNWYPIPSSPLAIDISSFMDCFTNIDNISPDSTYTITIYIEQPIPNTDATHDFDDPGHTFVSMSINDPNIPSNSITQTFGFYPSISVNPVFNNNDAPGEFRNNGRHNYNISASINVNNSNFYNIVYYIQGLGANIPEYHLENNNCTDVALNIGNLAGMSLPDNEGSWSALGRELGSGSNPGTLGQDVRGLNNPSFDVNIDDNGTNAPQSNGPCN